MHLYEDDMITDMKIRLEAECLSSYIFYIFYIYFSIKLYYKVFCFVFNFYFIVLKGLLDPLCSRWTSVLPSTPNHQSVAELAKKEALP